MSELSKNAIIYTPECDPKGIIQIIHGFADHQGRYRAMAQYFADHGFAVVTIDIKGHGNNASRPIELGFFGDNAVSYITGVIHENTQYLKDHFNNIPQFIIGQGMGALIATVYFKKYDNLVSGLFLSGLPSDRVLRPAASLLLFVLMALKGEYYRSQLVNALLMNRYYNKYLKEEHSYFAWLCSDYDSINKYEEDPKCGFLYTLNGYKTILDLMHETYGGISWIRKNRQCPVELLYGSDDAVIINEKSLAKNISLFTEKGYTSVSYKIYPDQRHELFQDIDKEIVYDHIIAECEAIINNETAEKPAEPHPTHIVLEDFIDPEVEKPIDEPEKINLEEFIYTHTPEYVKNAKKVETLEYSQIDPLPSHADPDPEDILDELLANIKQKNSSISIPDDDSDLDIDEFSDDNQRFLKDPNNLDGM